MTQESLLQTPDTIKDVSKANYFSKMLGYVSKQQVLQIRGFINLKFIMLSVDIFEKVRYAN